MARGGWRRWPSFWSEGTGLISMRHLPVWPCCVLLSLIPAWVFAQDPWSVAELVRSLKNPDAEVRIEAIRAIPIDAVDPDIILPILLRTLKDEDYSVRYAAVFKISQIDGKRESVVVALSGVLEDESRLVRDGAAYLLAGMGADARSALPALVGALGRAYPRSEVAAAVLRIESDHSEAVNALVEELQDMADVAVRRAAASKFEIVARRATAAIPALCAALQDSDRWVRQQSASALASIGPPAQGPSRLGGRAECGRQIRTFLSRARYRRHRSGQ